MQEFLDKLFTAQNLVPLALGLVAVYLLMSSLRRKQMQQARSKKNSGPRKPEPAQSQQLRMRQNIESLLVELQELSRKISAEIDTRFARLETVIRDADRRIATLHRLERQFADKYGEKKNPASDNGNLHTVVYELTDAGLSPKEVARDLGKTVGEVELILNLRAKQSRPSSKPVQDES